MKLRPQITAVHTQTGMPLSVLGRGASVVLGRVAKVTSIVPISGGVLLGHGDVAKTIQAGMVGTRTEPLADHRHDEGGGGQ